MFKTWTAILREIMCNSNAIARHISLSMHLNFEYEHKRNMYDFVKFN